MAKTILTFGQRIMDGRLWNRSVLIVNQQKARSLLNKRLLLVEVHDKCDQKAGTILPVVGYGCLLTVACRLGHSISLFVVIDLPYRFQGVVPAALLSCSSDDHIAFFMSVCIMSCTRRIWTKLVGFCCWTSHSVSRGPNYMMLFSVY